VTFIITLAALCVDRGLADLEPPAEPEEQIPRPVCVVWWFEATSFAVDKCGFEFQLCLLCGPWASLGLRYKTVLYL
jgi:hypothetical protein